MSNLRLKDHTWDAANVYDSVLGKTQDQINAEVGTSLAGKQGTLVSGENIKTVNGASILGSGNIEIQGGSTGEDGYSPVVTISNITGGHRVNITDKTHQQGQNFDVMDGAKGDTGDPAPASAVVPAVESWLEDNITQETGYVIDDSLTMTGAAADAKKLGDEISGLKSAVGDFYVDEIWTPYLYSGANHYNYYNVETQKLANSATKKYLCSDLLTVFPNYKSIKCNANNITFRVCWFDETGSVSTAGSTGYLGASEYDDAPDVPVSIPSNARKFLITLFKTDRSEIDSNDLNTIKESFVICKTTDDYLRDLGKAADAETSGKAIRQFALNGYNKLLFSEIEVGGIDLRDGSETAAAKRARRTNNFFEDAVIYMDTDDYLYRLYYFKTTPGTSSFTYSGKVTQLLPGTTVTYVDGAFGDRCRVVFQRADDAQITSADLVAIQDSLHIMLYGDDFTQHTVKRNNKTYVNQICALAQDWYSHRNDLNSNEQKALIYGNNSILNTSSYTREIDCSTFVGMLLRGYSFEQTPYYTEVGASPDSWIENPNYAWAINPFDWENYRRYDVTNKTQIRYASQIAQWMIGNGQTVKIDEHLSNIEPGDILFFARHDQETGLWVEPKRFMHINHIAICISRERVAQSTAEWDAAKYPWRHTFAEVSHEDETTPDGVVIIRVLEEPQNDPTAIFENNLNTLILVCRPDLGSI